MARDSWWTEVFNSAIKGMSSIGLNQKEIVEKSIKIADEAKRQVWDEVGDIDIWHPMSEKPQNNNPDEPKTYGYIRVVVFSNFRRIFHTTYNVQNDEYEIEGLYIKAENNFRCWAYEDDIINHTGLKPYSEED